MIVDRIKKYFRFLKFLHRAYSDYNHYLPEKKRSNSQDRTLTRLKNPTINNIVKQFEDVEVGVIQQSTFTLRLVVKNYKAPEAFKILVSILPRAEYFLSRTRVKATSLLDAPLSFESEKLKCCFKKNNRVYNVFIETYFRQSLTGNWQCVTKNNPIARILTDSFWSDEAQLKKKIAASSRAIKKRTGDIDVVYTWANIYDKDWLKSRKGFTDELQSIVDATSDARINDNSELKYSIRSIKLNAPWVRNIYIVSTGKPPEWLNIEASSSIFWITHDKIIEKRYIPTFNSHVIESNLHKIPGLSRKFIYMNDDIMIIKPMEREYFFEANGQPVAKMENYGVVNGEPEATAPDYLNASRNSANLIFRDFDYYPTRLHEHCPQILDREILAEIEDKYIDAFNDFRENRFRAINDINLTSFLYHHYAYITKRGVIHNVSTNKLIKNTSSWKKQLKDFDVNKSKFDTLCLNEGGGGDREWSEAIPVFLEKLFPHKCNWESV